MTKTALENKRIEAEKANTERSARAAEYSARKSAESKDKETAEKKRQFEKDYPRKWTETGSKAGGEVLGTVGKVIASAINDPKYYLSVPGFKEIATNIPDFHPLGEPITHMPVSTISMVQSDGKRSLPSVLALYTLPTFGKQDMNTSASGADPQSNLNLSLARLMNQARRFNSRIGEYEPGDAGQILIAACNIFERLVFVRRMLATYNLVDYGRIDIAKAIFTACGFQFALGSRVQDMAKAQWAIDKANTNLVIPKPFYYLERKLQLANALYGDQDLKFGQYITTGAPIRLHYDEANAVVTASQTTQILGSTCGFMSTYIDYIIEDLDALFYSQALTTFWADMRNAFKNYYTIPSISMGDKLEIKMVDEALHQILNVNMPPLLTGKSLAFNNGMFDLFNADCLAIRQDSRGLLYQGTDVNDQGVCFYDYHFNTAGMSLASIRELNLNSKLYDDSIGVKQDEDLFNYYTNDISSEEVMVSTRLHPTYFFRSKSYSGHSYQKCYVNECGTEIPFCFKVAYITNQQNNVTYAVNGTTAAWFGRYYMPMVFDVDAGSWSSVLTPANLKRLNSTFADFMGFDWAPKLTLVYGQEDTASTDSERIEDFMSINNYWQTGNVITITPENQAVLNKVALLSEFSIDAEPSFNR